MNELGLYILAALSAAKSGRVPYYTQPLTNAELEKAIIELGKDIDKKVAAIFRYKGSVANENSLPANAEIGDCYNVESTGANYAWNGSYWDKLSETIDLSIYVTNDSLTTILGSYYSKQESDTRYLTEHQDISGKADTVTVNNLKATVDTNSGNITSIQDRINALENRVIDLSKSNIEVINIEEDSAYNDTTKDYIISSNVSTNATVKGKSIELKDNEVDNARLTLESTGDITLSGVDYIGSYDKSVNPGNAMTSVRSDGYVVIKDCTLTPTKAYNGIEIGLGTGLAKNVLIDNVNFAGKFTNNAISIFGTTDNAVITISNCRFTDVSNAIRLSNRNNGKFTLNLVNCTIDSWELGEYAGAIILQDYTSANMAQAQENNLFAPDKVTLNIQNLTIPGGNKLTTQDVSTICGTKDSNQVIYAYNAYEGVLAYNANRYPAINIL